MTNPFKSLGAKTAHEGRRYVPGNNVTIQGDICQSIQELYDKTSLLAKTSVASCGCYFGIRQKEEGQYKRMSMTNFRCESSTATPLAE